MRRDNVNVTRRTLTAALAVALVPAGSALGLARAAAVPQATATYLLGPRMIRAEVALHAADGTTPDVRIDRGRLTKRYGAGALTLSEPFGTTVIKVSPAALVTLNGKASTLRALRPGMQVAIPRTNDQAAPAVYAGKTAPPKLPRLVVASLLSTRLLRAEVGLKSVDGVTHDYLLDHGRIKQVDGPTLILHEADGTIVTIATSPFVKVTVNGQTATYTQLHRGMMATTMHDGDKPTDQIWATGK